MKRLTVLARLKLWRLQRRIERLMRQQAKNQIFVKLK